MVVEHKAKCTIFVSVTGTSVTPSTLSPASTDDDDDDTVAVTSHANALMQISINAS